jgi:uncharacterized protein
MQYLTNSSPHVLMISLIAVVLVGLSKGGLGGTSLVGVPLMALVMPPMAAAALLLPILVVMDLASLTAWRQYASRPILFLVLPPALLGVGLGWVTAEFVSDAMVRLMVGMVSLAFVQRALWPQSAVATGRVPSWFGRLCGAIAGYTSFIAHAGGPPLQIYLLPKRLDLTCHGIFPPPSIRVRPKLRTDNEANEIYG